MTSAAPSSSALPRRVADELVALARIGGPVAIAQAGQATMNLIDTAVVGRLGANALAAVGLGNAMFFTVTLFGMGLVMGIDPLVAQAIGAGTEGRARQLFWQGNWLAAIGTAVVLGPMVALSFALEPFGIDHAVAAEARRFLFWRLPGVLPMLLFVSGRSYLQAVGRTRPLVTAIVLANVANLLGDLLFVFGGAHLPSWAGPLHHVPFMGAPGSALVTTVCTVLELVVVAAAIRAIPSAAEGPLWRPVRRDLRAASNVGVPVGLHFMAEIGVFALASLLAGRMGPESLAAHQIALSLASATFCIAIGFGSAGSVRVGWAVGARDLAAARLAGFTAILGSGATMALGALAFWAFPRSIAGLMTDRPDVLAVAAPLLMVAGAFQLSDGLQGAAAGVLRGAADSHFTFAANVLGHYGVGLPVALLLGLWLHGGVIGLWWGLCVGLTVVAIALLARFWRLSRQEIRPVQPSQAASS